MKTPDDWRIAYRKNRYLEGIELLVVVRRFRDLVENLRTLTPTNKLGLRPAIGPDRDIWLAFTETHEELLLRGNWPPPRLPKEPSQQRGKQHGQRANEAASRYPGDIKGVIVKYGRRKHIHDMLERGEFQISPASSYDDNSLNHALADDELSIKLFAQPKSVDLRTMDGRPIELTKPLEARFTTQTDYYVWCCSLGYDPRLFDDFSYDSCLLIRDIDRLCTLLTNAFLVSHPGWMTFPSRVMYVDPFRPPPGGRPIVHLVKDFRFYYQNEYRIVWLPPEPALAAGLEKIKIIVEPISDFCDVIDVAA